MTTIKMYPAIFFHDEKRKCQGDIGKYNELRCTRGSSLGFLPPLLYKHLCTPLYRIVCFWQVSFKIKLCI